MASIIPSKLSDLICNMISCKDVIASWGCLKIITSQDFAEELMIPIG